jgi:hypothetical protein
VAPVTFEHVQRAAQSLPGVELSSSYGTAALKVKGKLFARLHQSGESFVLRCEFLDREMLLQADPQVFYVTDHSGGLGSSDRILSSMSGKIC